MNKKIRTIIKNILPNKILSKYTELISLKYRIEALESEMKNMWLTERLKSPSQKQQLKLKEFKIYSQGGEDGVINYIFSKIGTKNKKFIEFGVEDGKECNTANLSMNFDWNGLLIEGDRQDASDARKFYKDKPVKVVNSFVTKENINKLFSENEITGEIDLLSIDIDGNDYWVWDAINVVNPRVVIIEYNSSFGDDKSISIKYDPSFERFKVHDDGLYYGASLSALTHLAKKKGYILVGCGSGGINAFFVRSDVAKGKLKELSVEEAFYKNNERLKRFGNIQQQFNLIKHLDFEKIN